MTTTAIYSKHYNNHNHNNLSSNLWNVLPKHDKTTRELTSKWGTNSLTHWPLRVLAIALRIYFSNSYYKLDWALPRNCSDANTTESHSWEVNIGSGNGLVPLPMPMLTEIYVVIWRHNEFILQASLHFYMWPVLGDHSVCRCPSASMRAR